jgi:hypothetical protein
METVMNKHPHCNGNAKQILCKYDCEWCYSRSFASSDKVDYWAESNNKTPREVLGLLKSNTNFGAMSVLTNFILVLQMSQKDGVRFVQYRRKYFATTKTVKCVFKSRFKAL